MGTFHKPPAGVGLRKPFSWVVLLAFFWIIAIFLQWRAQAYTQDFAGYPDEPAHYITGLLIHDYVAQGFPHSPVAFAENYYYHYPKIAIGHWPPLFHFIEGLWMLLFSTTRTSILLLMALWTAVVATVLSWRLLRSVGLVFAVSAGALFVLVPAVQEQTSMVMLETALAVFALLATFSFADYLDSGRWQDSALFGFWTLMAVLTKGNGWALVMIPPVAMIASRKWRMILQKSFWVGPAMLALIVPAQLMTLGMASEGWVGDRISNYTLMALTTFTVDLIGMVGPVLFCIAVLGLGATCLTKLFRREPVSSDWAAMLGLLISVLLFHSLVPAGIEIRKMVMGLPALIAFAAVGAWTMREWLSGFAQNRLTQNQFTASLSAGVVAILAIAFFVTTFRIPQKPTLDTVRAAATLRQRPDFNDAIVLVSGSATFEGAFISEVAMHERRPGHIVLRSSKLLAASGWSGYPYKLRFASSGDTMHYIDGLPIQYIATDLESVAGSPHHALLVRGVSVDLEEWVPVSLKTGESGNSNGIRIYQRRHTLARQAGALPAKLQPNPSMSVPWLPGSE